MKYFIIAGEASGDLHASNIVKQIKILDPNAEIQGWGGDMLVANGVNVNKHIRDLAIMGFIEVVKNIKTIQRNFKDCKKQIKDYNPDVVIFVDYPGFNLRMAGWAKKHNFKTIYFISPNVWAWKESRVKKIKKYVDKMYVILPFEKEFYKKHNFDVEYYGNPLVDLIKNYKNKPFDEFYTKNNLSGKPIIALMAGSRKQEISKILPIMVKVEKHFPDYEFVITGAPSIDKDFYAEYLKDSKIKLLFGQTYEILSHSTAGLITSGTATLEAALFKLPQVVCYKTSFSSALIAKLVLNIEHISLVNIILGKCAVTELLQFDLTEAKIVEELKKIIPNGNNLEQIQDDYRKLYNMLNNDEIYKNIASSIINFVEK
jgi:lipid-A-disaccharide synthase